MCIRDRELLDAITEKTKILILPYPNNPTGAIMEREDLEAIAKIVEEKDLFVISDEIYSELTYKGNPVSITQIPGMRERTVLINGFSKAYAMTGWRLGYACGPEVILKQMQMCIRDREYDVEMLTKNEASRQIDRILAAYGSLQK